MSVNRHYFGHAGEDAALVNTGTKIAAYNAQFGDLVPVNTTAGAVTVTLPEGVMIGEVAIRLQAGGNNLVIEGYGADTVDGAANVTLTQVGEGRYMVCDGAGAWTTLPGGPSVSGLAPVVMTVNTVAAAGATETIPEPAVAGLNDITLTADCTFTFPAASKGKILRMVVRQDGTGGWDWIWPANTIVPGGALVVTQAANAIDYIEAVCVVEDVWMIYRPGAAFA